MGAKKKRIAPSLENLFTLWTKASVTLLAFLSWHSSSFSQPDLSNGRPDRPNKYFELPVKHHSQAEKMIRDGSSRALTHSLDDPTAARSRRPL
jgi:hypothetical protein